MSWVNVLCDLYDKNEHHAGEVENIVTLVKKGKKTVEIVRKLVLLPESHSTAKAQIDVTIDEDGDFVTAETVNDVDASTTIPVTETSGNRTSGPDAHPLCDKLKYLAGDYDAWISEPHKGKMERENFNNYLKALRKWCDSDFAHPKAIAILKYLEKETLIHDLIRTRVLKTDEDGRVSMSAKIQISAQTDVFVRFRVLSEDCDSTSEVWLDRTLQKSFIEYYRDQMGESQLCYLTGEQVPPAKFHSRKIRNESDNAKLISSNDESNYTFRGRFIDKNEVFSIGYGASQKVHNALKWIVRKQGYTRDGMCYVTWESDLKNFFPFEADPTVVERKESEEPQEESVENTDLDAGDTNYISAQLFNRELDGYLEKLGNESQMVILELDSATPGRLAITYFNKLSSSRYIENIRNWHTSGKWMHTVFHDGKRYDFEGMPALRDLVLVLYGTEQNGMLAIKSKLMISVFRRLVTCIHNGAKIPRDMVRTAILRASSPLSYETYNWLRILSTACSLIRKEDYDYHQNKENWNMALDVTCNDRSYLYGRLLAVADVLEKSTFGDDDKKRQTNAMRFMNTFSRTPYKTWKILDEHLNPYRAKLGAGAIRYDKIIQDIMALMDFDDFTSSEPLAGCYLLGFYCQKKELYTKKENDESASGADVAKSSEN